ncbi:proteasome subunit beta type-6 [Nosema bombycis CQ1]|uniref:Proteasome subunit beta n=1 Tax=Nosema bombycis (strain CQ1 / CVCC 102059) TaxID=578461 RepID=R0MGX5_NOSB1|nr:proteasome subunit beta type-6 [Nosema bombycis CQ1]|eukprot:EOB13365.1 proteasome subunit beta type-6 [Nosema bombycis CQ1]
MELVEEVRSLKIKENTLEEMTGTTIMAVKYKDGILIGADCRTSMGSYIPSRITDKLTPLSENIFCCRSGSSADTQAIANYTKSELKYVSYLKKSLPSVKNAAMIAKNIIYRYPSLLAGLIIAGYDTEPRIYNISLGGTMVEAEWTIGGSGSGFIYGFCDTHFKPEMSLEEAIQFVKQSITLAIKRDNSSGGCIRMASITKEGVRRFFYSGENILNN